MTVASELAAARSRTSSRRASRRTRVQFLVTADETSLTELEALVATLPLCATGRVFVEVPDAGWIGTIDLPPRMTLTWLDRSARTGAPGSGRGCAPGGAIVRAVAAWADEMLCHEGREDSTTVHLLGGYLGTADIHDDLVGRIGIDGDRVHTPERFGLHTTR
jgi:NADPH-dependent ferric siderophore reductase